jgi:hypothetical protein
MNNMVVHAGSLYFMMAIYLKFESLNLKMAESLNIGAFVNLQDGRYRGNFEL